MLEKKRERKVELTNGPIVRSLIELSLPIMASSFLATAYNITDMAWIGILGSRAVAGVGVGGMYLWLSQGLVSMAKMGGQVKVGQCCGQEDWERAREYARGALQLTILFALAFSTICLIFTGPLIDFFGMKDSLTFDYAWSYMKITCGFLIFSYMNQTLTGLYTAQGDSVTPFKANLVGLAANMVLDPLLILGVGPFPELGVGGAAIATVFAQFLVMGVMLLSLRGKKKEQNVLHGCSLLVIPPKICFRDILTIGFPTAVQGTLYCGFSMVLTRMVAGFGPGAVATQRVGGQIESISWNTADGFAAALNAFVAQNYGAGKPERIKKGYSVSFKIVALWGLLVTLLFVGFPEPMARVFFHEEEVVQIAVGYLVILGLGEGFMCVELATIGALSGLGKTKICSVLSILLTGIRIPMAYILSRMLGITGIWWALTISSVLKGIVFYFTFQKSCRQLVKA